MKKVLCLMLAVLLLLPTVLVAHAEPMEFVCTWATEREFTDSLGTGVIYFGTHPQAERYLVDVYKDGQFVEQVETYGSPMDEYAFCVLEDVIVRNGDGTYTCTASAVDFEYGYEPGVGQLFATTPMSNPYIFTAPATVLPPVTNVRFENNAVYFDHDTMGIKTTYDMDFYIEFGDVLGESFSSNSTFDKAITEERYGFAMQNYEQGLAWMKENDPKLSANGEPRIMIEIYAKAWDINLAQPSPKVYFYPNGEKPTRTDPYIVPTWSTAKMQQISFAGDVSALEAYNINDNNYFKLRDVALKLSQMGVPVDVTWDENVQAINLVSGQPYTQVGGELKVADGALSEAIPNKSKIYLNGKRVELQAYTINGNNFFKLRDLCGVLGVDVGWSEEAQLITLTAQ